jgi:small multidrug resistance pump
MSWILLAGAIAFEVAATSCMKASDGLTKPTFTALMVAGYVVSFTLLARALKEMEVGIAYAVWSGVGTAAIAAIGVAFFHERTDPVKLASIGLIILGVIGVNISGGTH